MALVVEDGTGLAGAESYVSAADCAAYATARGLTFATGTSGEQALRRATAWIDASFGPFFRGYPLRQRAQALEWPRVGATDAIGYPIGSSEIPAELKNALCEAAIRELAESGSLAPDLDRGGAIQSMQAGSVSITYASGAPSATTFQAIENALSRLIGNTRRMSGVVARG